MADVAIALSSGETLRQAYDRRRQHLLDDILHLQQQGLTGSEVGQAVGLSQVRVAELARRAGSPFARRGGHPRPYLRQPVHQHPGLASLYGQIRHAARSLDLGRLDHLVRQASRAWGTWSPDQEVAAPTESLL